MNIILRADINKTGLKTLCELKLEIDQPVPVVSDLIQLGDAIFTVTERYFAFGSNNVVLTGTTVPC